MGMYDNLPVFKATYDVLLRLYHLDRHWSRDLRYTLGEDIKREAMDILLLIYQANASEQKVDFIARARVSLVKVRLQLRIAHDLKAISLKQYVSIADQTESISKQLTAWEKSQRKKQQAESLKE